MKTIPYTPWAFVVTAAIFASVPLASAQTDPLSPSVTGSTASPVQSPARPFGLNIVNPVQLAGSDANSAAFSTNVLPVMKDAITSQLPERFNNTAVTGVDPQKLTLDGDYSVRVYFISEGAAFRNTLGFNTIDPTKVGQISSSPDAKLIFPNASDPNGLSGSRVLSETEPVKPGDFVNLGIFTKGTQLDFFMVASGASGGTTTFSTQASFNSDGLRQSIVLAPAGSSYLLMGFEDVKINGGDKDLNDLMFAVELVRVGAPEPSLAAGMVCVGLLGLTRRRRVG